jgi:hypothetical protein
VLKERLHVCPRGHANRGVVERRRIAFEDGALAACVPNLDLRPVLCGARRSRQRQLCAQLIEFNSEHLAQARRAVSVQYDIAAYLEFQAVQRGLKGEPAPVNRGSERKDCLFQAPARLAEALQLGTEPAAHKVGGHIRSVFAKEPRGVTLAG